MDMEDLLNLTDQISKDHAQILEKVDTSKTRVVTVESIYSQISGLSDDQKEFLTSAIEAAKHGLYRAAIVMAWAAIADRLQELHVEDGFNALHNARPNWKEKSREELQEKRTEFAIIDASRDSGFLSKAQAKTFHGFLNQRNRAAHPGKFNPSFNSVLGYIEDVLSELGDIS